MIRRIVLLLGVVLTLSAGSGALTSVAQTPAPFPSARMSSLEALSEVDRRSLPDARVPNAGAEANAAADTSPRAITPYRYGVTVEAGVTPGEDGTWERAGDAAVWRLRLQSHGAVSLSVAFDRFDLPAEAELYVRDLDGRSFHGPYTAGDATNGRHRSPLIRSDEVVVELLVPAERRERVDLRISHVVHGYRSAVPPVTRAAQAKDGTCNVDVTCPEGDPWDPVYRSVGLYTYETEGQAATCTGSLINTTGATAPAPVTSFESESSAGRIRLSWNAPEYPEYFLTAEHCISSPEAAESMVFYWNYQSPTCRRRGTPENAELPDDNRRDQTSTGAILQARFGNVHRTGSIGGRSDLALVEIDDVLSDSYNVYFAGWDRSGDAAGRAVSVHHPDGSAKRISFDNDPISRTPYAQEARDPNGTHWLVEAWELGTTEPGSSGAPLYNEDQRIIGVLSGGRAACVPGTARDNNAPDWYGSLAHGFNRGDFDGVTLADLLDPTGTGQLSISGRMQGDDDELVGRTQRYVLRYRTGTPIVTEEDFRTARKVDDVPSPAEPGARQSTTLSVDADSTYYFAIRAIDEFGNASPITILRDAGVAAGIAPVGQLRVSSPFPNPSTTSFTVKLSSPMEANLRLELYDTLGRFVRLLDVREVPAQRETTARFDIGGLSAGIYFLRVRGAGDQQVKRLSVVP
jgi:lysyl endopeptidase